MLAKIGDASNFFDGTPREIMQEIKMTDPSIISYLKKHCSPRRLNHVFGVMRLADRLAVRYHLDRKKVMTAGALHDLARSWSEKKIVRYAQKHSLRIPNKAAVLRSHPMLFHGAVSAHLARKLFNVRDAEILSAISKHSFGAVKMSLFEKLIVVADLAAPDRTFAGRSRLVRLAFKDINLAYKEALRIKMIHLLKTDSWIFPDSVKVWNSEIKMAK